MAGMDDPRRWLALLAVVTVVGLGLLVVDVLNIGMAAAWAGDTETVGSAIIVLMLIILAAVLGGLVRDR